MMKKILMGLGVVFALLIVSAMFSDSGTTTTDGGTTNESITNEATPAPVVEEAPDGSFGDGVWIVGEDIDPGTYRTTSDGLCYWERMRDFSGEDRGIIAWDYASLRGPVVVEIKATDAGFKSEDCGTWEKI